MIVVVHGKTTSELACSELRARIVPYRRTVIDLGTGDGRFAYHYARQHSDAFVIGIDPVREAMREFSARALRKPERGGTPNLLYVVASIEHIPDGLRALADEMYITLPWGSLMRGLILGEDLVLAGVASLARADATLRIILNTRIFDDPVPADVLDLPNVTPEYGGEVLAPAYTRHRIEITETRWMDAMEVASLPTTWAKRLSHRAPPRSVYIEATVAHPT